MDREDFAIGQRSHVVRTESGYLAFVPPPLPLEFDLDRQLVQRLSVADRAIGELAGAGRTLPNPMLLAGPIVRREAVLSSRIEGTQASYDDLALFEVEPVGAERADVREVHNYVAALERLLDPDRRYPLSLPLLLQAHETLLTGVRGSHATPGEFRRSPNWIGPPGCTLSTATYVSPPPERLWECLDSFEKYLYVRHHMPPLVTIGCLHYQFEAIHPFIDGNGRVGRLLIVLLMIEWGLLPAPLLDLSAWIEPRRDDYYRHLLRVSTHADWLGWLGFFLTAVAEQASDALLRARRLHTLQGEYRARVAAAGRPSHAPQLVDALFVTPAMTINRAARLLGVTHRGASQMVTRLVAAELLTEVAPAGRTRLFVAREIIAVASGDQVEVGDGAGRAQ